MGISNEGMQCKCGYTMRPVDRWDDAQETDHCYNLYTCDKCGMVLKDSIWVDPHQAWVDVRGAVDVRTEEKSEWTTLGELREGAVFETRLGVRAVKSEYMYSSDPDGQCRCVLLASGEYAHFPQRNATEVRELEVGG